MKGSGGDALYSVWRRKLADGREGCAVSQRTRSIVCALEHMMAPVKLLYLPEHPTRSDTYT